MVDRLHSVLVDDSVMVDRLFSILIGDSVILDRLLSVLVVGDGGQTAVNTDR